MRAFLLAILLIVTSLRAGAPGNGITTCPASGNKVLSTLVVNAQWIQLVSPGTTAVSPVVANTGNIFIGSSTVSTSSGAFMTPGQSWLLDARNGSPYQLNQIYFACTASTDTIYWTYFQ